MSNHNVLFFVENKWALGQIHHALVKRLWERKIFSHVLPWEIPYTAEEMGYLKSKYDTFVTLPGESLHLINNGVDPKNIVVMAHHEKDINQTVARYGKDYFSKFKGYGVVHEHMVDISAQAGISRIPIVAANGVDFDHYYTPVSPDLKTVGTATAFKSTTSRLEDFKRGYLIPHVLIGLNLTFVKHSFMYHLCMPSYYAKMDALLSTSAYEGSGLPVMEAAAAGRLVLSAAVGCFDGNSGILCRTPDDEYIEDARKALEACRDDSKLYREHCERAQQYARDNFDWSHKIDSWIELFGA